MKPCLQCGTMMTQTRGQKLYCSGSCQAKAYKEITEMRDAVREIHQRMKGISQELKQIRDFEDQIGGSFVNVMQDMDRAMERYKDLIVLTES